MSISTMSTIICTHLVDNAIISLLSLNRSNYGYRSRATSREQAAAAVLRRAQGKDRQPSRGPAQAAADDACWRKEAGGQVGARQEDPVRRSSLRRHHRPSDQRQDLRAEAA